MLRLANLVQCGKKQHHLAMSEPTIEPLSGFRDLLPQEAADRRALLTTALHQASLFGYQQIDTPALEREEILRGQYGDEGDSLRYRFRDQGDREVGLRYDLTVPFSRYVSRFLPRQAISNPFRRSHAAPVWRAEHAQAGRYREFYQCDFDIAGSAEPSADAEILQLGASILEKIALPARMRVSHRGVIDAILSAVDVSEHDTAFVLGYVDKWDKIGPDAVREELRKRIGDTADRLVAILAAGDCTELQELLGDNAALQNLRDIISLAQTSWPSSIELVIDFSIVRGLSYYTGMVFESFVTGSEALGSILSGGRYDGMVGTFMGRPLPAVGGSVGVDRTLAVCAQREHTLGDSVLATVALLPMSTDEVPVANQIAQALRSAGVQAVLYSGSHNAPGKLLGYASGVARYAVLIGGNEVASNSFALRNLTDRTEVVYSQEELVAQLAKLN
jgi:histidyl-tRNA synthetase